VERTDLVMDVESTVTPVPVVELLFQPTTTAINEAPVGTV
jgi:hypothetical protein